VTSSNDVDDTVCDAAHCSLREAIAAANNQNAPEIDEIHFAITGTGVQTIVAATPLPTITEPLTIDGATQPDYNPFLPEVAPPVIQIRGPSPVLNVAADATIRALALSSLQLESGTSTVQGCYIGISSTGGGLGGDADGLVIESSGNTIGGTSTSTRNLISRIRTLA
jgi:CSLREA domain-containing protein